MNCKTDIDLFDISVAREVLKYDDEEDSQRFIQHDGTPRRIHNRSRRISIYVL